MKTKHLVLPLALVLFGGGYGLYWLGLQQGMKSADTVDADATNAVAPSDASSAKKVLYWHDPMIPGPKFDQPGKSPFMDMQLVPMYAGAAEDDGKVTISPRVQQNLGVRVAEVTKGMLATGVETVGSVAYNERDVAVVQARANGFLERLYVRAPLDAVRKGQPLAELYVPDWIAAQEEYLSVVRMHAAVPSTTLAALRDGARQRMRLAGMADEQIDRIDTTGKVQPRVTITAPASGVVTELMAREGMTVMAGAPLFKINGLASVWINAEVPESQAAQVQPGNAIEARTAAFPGITFKGRVSAILPEINPATRTLKARIEVSNPKAQLVPGMFARISLTPTMGREVLLIPSAAVIQTGTRNVVMAALGEGRFMPVEVELGVETNGQTEIRKGLEAGQKVVVSGQFLVDSEASLKGVETRMGDVPTMGKTPADTSQGMTK